MWSPIDLFSIVKQMATKMLELSWLTNLKHFYCSSQVKKTPFTLCSYLFRGSVKCNFCPNDFWEVAIQTSGNPPSRTLYDVFIFVYY